VSKLPWLASSLAFLLSLLGYLVSSLLGANIVDLNDAEQEVQGLPVHRLYPKCMTGERTETVAQGGADRFQGCYQIDPALPRHFQSRGSSSRQDARVLCGYRPKLTVSRIRTGGGEPKKTEGKKATFFVISPDGFFEDFSCVFLNSPRNETPKNAIKKIDFLSE
jgi:hypothetical protein